MVLVQLYSVGLVFPCNRYPLSWDCARDAGHRTSCCVVSGVGSQGSSGQDQGRFIGLTGGLGNEDGGCSAWAGVVWGCLVTGTCLSYVR